MAGPHFFVRTPQFCRRQACPSVASLTEAVGEPGGPTAATVGRLDDANPVMIQTTVQRPPIGSRQRGVTPTSLGVVLGLVAFLLPGAQVSAQVVELLEARESEGYEERAEVERPSPPQGRIYTWKDGDRTRRAYLQSDLVVSRKDAALSGRDEGARPQAGKIVRVAGASETEGEPVFRSSSGALMTLPGGVLLVFDSNWGEAETAAFFDANGIAMDRVSPLGAIPNGFVVETDPGFPSLELANSLVGRGGVRLSSPNWWKERSTR